MKLLFQDEIQRIGDAIGLKGKFLIEWGTDDIIREFRMRGITDSDKARIIERLDIAQEQLQIAQRIIAELEG